MGFLGDIWNGLKDGLEAILRFYEGLLEPFFGLAAWGVAIILLTITVRMFMIPLMVRQTKSMRSMQTVQPEMKKIQEKYKADRSMMKTDPERYKKLKEKQREAQMELYQEHGVNPVGGCLPLLLQMPVFLALFQVLQDAGPLRDALETAPFLGISSLTATAAGGAGIGAIILVILQAGTTYYSQKQMMARNTTAGAEQAQAQKIMLYIMPLFLGYLSFTFPIGVVLYWVTTNFWTIGQQAVIFRQVEAKEAQAAEDREAAKREKAQRTHVDDVTKPAESPNPTKRSGKGSRAQRTNNGGGSPEPTSLDKSSSEGDGSAPAPQARRRSGTPTPGTGKPRNRPSSANGKPTQGRSSAGRGNKGSGNGSSSPTRSRKGGGSSSSKGKPTKPGSSR